MSTLIASTVGEIGIVGAEAGASENAAVQNSSVFNPALAYNSTGYKDIINSSSGNIYIIFILIFIIIAIFLLR